MTNVSYSLNLNYLLVGSVLGIVMVVATSSALAQQPPASQVRPKADQAESEPYNSRQPVFESLLRNPYESRLLAAALGLTEDQQIRIRQVYRQHGLAMASAFKDMRARRFALDDALFSDEFNEAAVNQRAKDLAEAQTQLLMIQTKVQSQLRQILTTDQLHKFMELRHDEGPRRFDKQLQKQMRKL
ncbi:MAG: periplasmic heavy metal sensor [Acidobacteria bacterium]|nr:periplasmic heavy metal sensor [Acidobacteriota bacterium]